MKPKEFIRRTFMGWAYKDDMTPLYTALIERLAEKGEFERKPPQLYDNDIADVIVRAGIIRDQKKPIPEKKEVLSGPPAMREVIEAEQIADYHEKEVRWFRFRLFGSVKPPFDNMKSTLDWINRESESGGGSYSSAWIPDPLTMDSSGNVGIGRLPVRSKTPLYRLARKIWGLSQATTFDSLSIMWWILLGTRPAIPRFRVFRHTAYPLFPYLPALKWVTLEIRASDVTFRELRQIQRQLPKAEGKRRQKINRWHKRIYELVKDRRIPRDEKVRFWEKIGKQLKKEGCRKPPSWRGIRKAYLEIQGYFAPKQHIGGLIFQILNPKTKPRKMKSKLSRN